ncbi:MAG: hypothetical protein K2J01_04395 [Clostridiales bacterium]|nr:hypothetical protein [Clostridiales bacterium]
MSKETIKKENCKNLISSDFYKDILDNKEAEYLIEKHILHNIPFYFKDNMDLLFNIKKQIGEKYNVSITNIYLVGSGQLGFSLAPQKEYRDFVHIESDVYKKRSDLDFAIISERLFGQIWDEICDYRLGELAHNKEEKELFQAFQNYLFKGWIRPDLFPFDFPMKKDWFEFFKQFNPLVNRQVSCGIFRNETSFLKQYRRSIKELIQLIRMEVL